MHFCGFECIHYIMWIDLNGENDVMESKMRTHQTLRILLLCLKFYLFFIDYTFTAIKRCDRKLIVGTFPKQSDKMD